MWRLILAAAAILLTIEPAMAAPDYEGLVRSLTDKVVIPAYHRLAGKTATLAVQAEAFCTTPDRSRASQAIDSARRRECRRCRGLRHAV